MAGIDEKVDEPFWGDWSGEKMARSFAVVAGMKACNELRSMKCCADAVWRDALARSARRSAFGLK